MKKLLMMFVLLTSFVFSASVTPKLDTPSNFSYDGALTWDEVDYAQTYMITINDENFERDIAYLDGFIQEGQYSIEVIARADGYEDSLMGTYVFEIDYNQEANISVYLNNQILSWNEIDQATHYLVTFDFNFVIVDTNEFELPSENIENYSVQAVFPDGSKTAIFS